MDDRKEKWCKYEKLGGMEIVEKSGVLEESVMWKMMGGGERVDVRLWGGVTAKRKGIDYEIPSAVIYFIFTQVSER